MKPDDAKQEEKTPTALDPSQYTALTKDQIVKAQDLAKQLVPVPEWGAVLNVPNAAIWVRAFTADEQDAIEAHILATPGMERNLNQLRAIMCARAICDSDGKRLFNDMEVRELGKKSAKALNRVFTAVRELNGTTDQDVKELLGNSDAGRGDASPSASAGS